jgi:hypothetical protein
MRVVPLAEVHRFGLVPVRTDRSLHSPNAPPQLKTSSLSESPAGMVEMDSNVLPRPPLPASLQRLSNRLSRGGEHLIGSLDDVQPTAAQPARGATSDVPSQRRCSLRDAESRLKNYSSAHFTPVHIVASVPPTARATPAQEGHRSQSRRHRST